MGFEYLGPIDGHDVNALEAAIRLAKDMREPVIVHVLTKKGKGCKYAEEYPEKYHGVGPFDPLTGEVKESGRSFSDCFGDTMCELAAKDERVCAITAAMCFGTGLSEYARQFPARFMDIGIAEGHATAMAAGMAKQGAIPVFAVYSSFLQRAYDMLIHDVSLQRLHTVFAVDRSGLVGSDGETHHGVFDINYLCSVPYMTVMSPASFAELHDMLEEAVFNTNGPVAVRYPRGGEAEYTESHVECEFIAREGSDVTIVCYGVMINQALKAAAMLEERGISAEIVKLGIIKPNEFEKTLSSTRKTKHLVVVEECCAMGCIGERILSQCAMSGVALDSARLINLGEGIVQQGTVTELERDHGIDAQGIVNSVLEMCNMGQKSE